MWQKEKDSLGNKLLMESFLFYGYVDANFIFPQNNGPLNPPIPLLILE